MKKKTKYTIINIDKDGLYLFPDGNKFSLYGLYLRRIIEIGTTSIGELLIEFLDFDYSKISSLMKKTEAFNGNAIFNEIDKLNNNLQKILTYREWVMAYDLSPEGWQDEYSFFSGADFEFDNFYASKRAGVS